MICTAFSPRTGKLRSDLTSNTNMYLELFKIVCVFEQRMSDFAFIVCCEVFFSVLQSAVCSWSAALEGGVIRATGAGSAGTYPASTSYMCHLLSSEGTFLL